MKIVHQIFYEWSNSEIAVLQSHGVHVAPGYQQIVLEEDARYWELKPLIDAWGATDMVGTEFSAGDIQKADILMAYPAWQSEYPQPERNFGYRSLTYDSKHYCASCGIGLIQKAPFRLKKEVKWGRKQALMLNWVFDEIFVRKDTYEEVFLPLGIDHRPVLLHKNDSIIESIVQLIIPESVVPLELEGYASEICEVCGKRKYLPVTRGFFPPFSQNVSSTFPIIKSQEYGGSGASAFKWIFVSQETRLNLEKQRVNMTYVPQCNRSETPWTKRA